MKAMKLSEEELMEIRKRAYLSSFSRWQGKIKGLLEKIGEEVPRDQESKKEFADSVDNFGLNELLGNLEDKLRVIERSKEGMIRQLNTSKKEDFYKKSQKFKFLLEKLPDNLRDVLDPYLNGKIEIDEKMKNKIKSSELYHCLR